MVDLLVQAGARLNVRSEWSGRTALHEAVMFRNYEAVEALLHFGIDTSARDNDGKTARELYWAEPRLDALFASQSH
jgi:ankyrin repeat protein